MLFKRCLKVGAILSAVVLAACGGGSDGASGTSSSLLSNKVSVGTVNLTAGGSTALGAYAIIRGAAPTTMIWSAVPLGATNISDPSPLVFDINCANATFSPPAVAGASGEGSCRTVLSIPSTAKAGTWRIVNTAAAGTFGSVSNYVDINIAAIPTSGFAAVQSSTPVTGYVNKQLSLNVPFTVSPGAVVTDVTYLWTASPSNPAIVAIAGSNNSTATVVPVAAGQYGFDVKINARINGYDQTVTGTVVAIVNSPSFVDVIDAGLVQSVQSGSAVRLGGAILNRDAALSYSESWSQLTGSAGGPVAVTLSNAGTGSASFIAPSTRGSYGFQYQVIKTQADGSQSITTSQTTVVVQEDASSLFTLNAGNAQVTGLNSPVILTGSVGTQGTPAANTSYAYTWTQVGGTPATVTLSNANSTTASFVPTIAGTYTFNLTVSVTQNGSITTVSGQTQVVASSGSVSAPTATFAMSANAGPAQSVALTTVASLTGSQTSQGTTNGVTYAFAWTAAPANPAVVALSNPNSAVATFIPTVAGSYSFTLTITATLPDATTRTATSTTQVLVGGVGNSFSVSAGDAKVDALNAAVTLSSTLTVQGSFAGTTFSYQWTQVGATPAATTLSNANTSVASFIPTVAGTYTFQVVATATQGATSSRSTSQTQVLVN